MLFHSIPRPVSPSALSKSSKLWLFRFCTTVSAADRLLDRLLTCPSNVERALASVSVKLDASCVGQVMARCKPNQFHSGLRFFIWAGTQSGYRHSPFMYSKACDLFEIRRNPGIIKGVMDAYRTEKCWVSVKTLRVVLTLCNQAKLANEALWILRTMSEFNSRPDTVAYNLVIRSFVDNGDLDMAEKLMKEMDSIDLYPDAITYKSMVDGFCNVGRLEEAWKLVQAMNTHGCSVGTVIYSRLLEGFCQSNRMETALDLLGLMEREDGSCSPSTVTYTLVIQAFCERKMIQEALSILDRMESRGLSPSRVTASILIKGHLENKDRKEVFDLIDRLSNRGGIPIDECYSSAVICLGQMTRREEAEKLFRQMLGSGMRPDGCACSLVLRELCSQERYLECFTLYEDMEKMKVKSSIDSDIYSVLLRGLSEKGHSLEAAKLKSLVLEKKI